MYNRAKHICNLITQTGLKIANKKKCSINELGIKPYQVAKLAEMIEANQISISSSHIIFEALTNKNGEEQKQACSGGQVNASSSPFSSDE